MDASDNNRTSRPIQEETIGRIAEGLKKIVDGSSIRTVARNSGVSASTLHSYLNGEGLRTIANLIAIAEAGGESFESLLGIYKYQTNKQPEPLSVQHPPVAGESGDGSLAKTDKELLQRILLGIEEGLEATGRRVTPEKKVELTFALYEIFRKSDAEPDSATILPFLKLA